MSPLPPGFSSSGNLAIDRRYRWAKASFDAGEAAEACEILLQAIEAAPSWGPACKLLADALLVTGNAGEAREAYEQTVRLDPEGVLGAKLALSRQGSVAPEEAMQAGYVAALFDDYADHFDSHLTKVLFYRGPEAILSALRSVRARDARDCRFRGALDLGCGTGLMGAAIRPFVGELSGVDLSAGMIAKARAKLLYDRLEQGDILDFLRAQPRRSVDLVLAADAMVYIAELAPVFAAVAGILCSAGLFAFTLQSPDAECGYLLGPDNRFAHSESLVRASAASSSLDVAHLAAVVTRQDAGRDVPGLVVVLDHARGNYLGDCEPSADRPMFW